MSDLFILNVMLSLFIYLSPGVILSFYITNKIRSQFGNIKNALNFKVDDQNISKQKKKKMKETSNGLYTFIFYIQMLVIWPYVLAKILNKYN